VDIQGPLPATKGARHLETGLPGSVVSLVQRVARDLTHSTYEGGIAPAMNKELRIWMALIVCLVVLTACRATGQPTDSPLFSSPLPPATESPEPIPSLSDSELILFTSNRDGSTAHYVMRPDGSSPHRLTFPAARVVVLGPTWVPSLERFIFSGSDDAGQDIYLSNWEGTEFENLTNTPDWTETTPRVSPDGKWVAMDCAQAEPDLCLVAADGSGWTQLTTPPAWDSTPVWSPDSKRVVYVSNAGGISDLYVMGISDDEPTKLTTDEGRHTSADWSPDGDQIAYQADVDGAWDIWTISPKGGEPRNLTQSSGPDEMPRWSPDGKWIAFRSKRDGDSEIYVMAADGQDPRNISQSPASTETVFFWSPDSQRLLFVSDADGNLDIFVVNRDGSGKMNLTQHPSDDAAPMWLPRQ
jgi:Tol biopolymer transport system component